MGLNWRVLVAGQRSDWSPPGQSTDYAAPVIESVVPASGGLLDTAGGDEVVISGANFGPPPQSDDASQRLTVTYGSSSTDRYVYGVGAVLCLESVGVVSLKCRCCVVKVGVVRPD